VAATPASAISSAASRSSYSASSMRVPVKTCAMPEPVLRRPWRRRSNQRPRGGASGTGASTGAGAAEGTDGASAISAPGGLGAVVAGTAQASGAGPSAGGGFFLKKLNMWGEPRGARDSPL
jgi:hypothetical protein